MNSFEFARGYTPYIIGIPKLNMSGSIWKAPKEQVSNRAFGFIQKSHQLNTLSQSNLARSDKVYFFKLRPKFGIWKAAFVRSTTKHLVVISQEKNNIGKTVNAEYEDVRQAPSSILLQELDNIDLVFPRSYSVVDEDIQYIVGDCTTETPPIFTEL